MKIKNNLIAKTSISIDATPAQVRKALTTPRLIKKYLMGKDASSDWKEGSPITYTGEYEGKKYQDKGIINYLQNNKTGRQNSRNSHSGQ